jgi:hypothetical protein
MKSVRQEELTQQELRVQEGQLVVSLSVEQ